MGTPAILITTIVVISAINNLAEGEDGRCTYYTEYAMGGHWYYHSIIGTYWTDSVFPYGHMQSWLLNFS